MANLREQVDVSKSNGHNGGPKPQVSPRKRFELVRLEDPRGVSLLKLPGRHEHHRYVGHVYVVELSGGTTKLGRTANPFGRISRHAEQAAPYGAKILRLWVSIAHRNPVEVEQALIRHARENSVGAIRNEYFQGLDFSAVVEAANRMSFQAIDLGELAEAERARVPLFGRVGPPREDGPDVLAEAQAAVAALFGRGDDGTQSVPVALEGSGSKELHAVLSEIAQAKGCSLQDVLALTWVDVLEEMTTAIVRTEALRLKAYACKTGQTEILETLGDRLAQAVFAEQFGTSR